jgi:FAD/FMN-containing dehydrogenase
MNAGVSQAMALQLGGVLSDGAHVFTNPESTEFKASMSRWTDVNKQTPTAILQPATELDVEEIVPPPIPCPISLLPTLTHALQVYKAVKSQIPIVIKSGGNGPWSTISSGGWIIDLSLLSNFSLDTQNQTATIQPGVLSKTINVAVQEAGFCIQSPGSAKVSCVGFLLGGGSSYLNGLYGMGVDSLVSARVVTAYPEKGTVVCSEEENEELFWAIKGAGQFFGVVTEVTMKMYPLKEEEGPLSWTMVFTADKMKEVALALEQVSKGQQVVRSPGLAMVMAMPGFQRVCISPTTLSLILVEER